MISDGLGSSSAGLVDALAVVAHSGSRHAMRQADHSRLGSSKLAVHDTSGRTRNRLLRWDDHVLFML